MTEYFPEDHRFYLEHELELRLKRRPQYSLRAFARDLSLSPSTLSEFLSGHLGLSRDTAGSVAKKINLNEMQAQHMWDLIESRFSRSPQKRKEAVIKARSRIHSEQAKISLDEFRFIADWYHLAILELIELSSEYQDKKKLAKSLGISLRKTEEAIERLVKLKLLKRLDGSLLLESNTTNVGDNVSSESVRLFHSQILAKAHEALESQTLDRRDFSSTIFSLALSDLPQIKKDLNQFWLEIASKYSAKEKKDSLYCLSIQLFDLLKSSPTPEKAKESL